jgi:cell division protein FtsX
MKNAKTRTTATVAFMIVLAIAILLFYYYWSNRTESLASSGKKVSQEQALINKDLTMYYPETPREVVKMFAGIMKALYCHPSEDEIKPLALKVRELYDQELLNKTRKIPNLPICIPICQNGKKQTVRLPISYW